LSLNADADSDDDVGVGAPVVDALEPPEPASVEPLVAPLSELLLLPAEVGVEAVVEPEAGVAEGILADAEASLLELDEVDGEVSEDGADEFESDMELLFASSSFFSFAPSSPFVELYESWRR
jgi:hypothetical protein